MVADPLLKFIFTDCSREILSEEKNELKFEIEVHIHELNLLVS